MLVRLYWFPSRMCFRQVVNAIYDDDWAMLSVELHGRESALRFVYRVVKIKDRRPRISLTSGRDFICSVSR